MQQRQLRLGDILDDYCPRERRITNHAVVAMVGVDVKQTRCTTCDAEHEYKGGKIPPQRKKKESASLYRQVLAGASKGSGAPASSPEKEPSVPEAGRLLANESVSNEEPSVSGEPPDAASEQISEAVSSEAVSSEEEGPVHRPLIRATLPRTEGAAPMRQIPEFTVRQNGGRSGKFRVTTPHRHRPAGSAGPSGGSGRHIGRSGMPGGRSGNRTSPQHHRPAHQPHGARVARPGKKRSR